MKREELVRYDGEWYDANIVDCLLDEKDAEIEDLLRQNRELCQALQVMYSKEEYGKLQKEIESLNAKLESVQASAYADSVDAGMRERRLNRALWLARAKRAIEKIAWFKLWNGSISTMNPEDGARQEFDKWKKNLGKFLKNVEEYR